MSTPATSTPRRPVAWLRENRDSARVLWGGFALVHVLLSLLALFAPGLPMGDVSIVYKQWMQTAVDGGAVAGIDTGWVYPILAWVPIAASWLLGAAGYDLMWLLLVAAVDAAAFALLVRGAVPVRLAAARWWLLFLVLLGPIAVGRIDAFTVPPAIAGMLWAGTRPAASALLLTIATWIKVWPAAILAASVLVLRGRVKTVLVPVVTSAVIVLAVVLIGGGDQVFSFVGDQTTRGLQIEAVVSTPWMWAASLGAAGGSSYVWYAADINTFEMHGPGTEIAATVMTPLLALTMIGVALLGLRALRAGAAPTRLFPLLALTFVVVFIDTNKVLSPQYIAWLAPPVIAALVVSRDGWFATPAKLTLVIGALTQIVYPYLYLFLLWEHWWMVLVLTARNVVLVVLLGWLVRELWRAGRAPIERADLSSKALGGASQVSAS
ncbi:MULTISPECIES: glycosyltransferase 87 family protein [unclassified Rathayibacter]|uniref:glycosyltransferase 87 family protein n=1 Tax=unclassified Rathayibacter TaxID=2609250 RepID=UPI0012E94CFE|nr:MULTISPECIES: glycosyltransferase 87 family protein [unclassified Rathayibacter]